MDILLYKDGHLSISESPLQGKENNLDDVVMLVSNPQEGDTLTYKGGKWVNGEGGGGGGGLVVHVTTNDGVFYADHTAGEIIAAANTGTVISIITVSDVTTNIGLLNRIENYLDEVEDSGVAFIFSTGNMTMELTAVSADDYPSFDPNSDG